MTGTYRAAVAYLAAVETTPDLSGLTAHLLDVAYPLPGPLPTLPAVDPRPYRCARCERTPVDRGPAHLPTCPDPDHGTSYLLTTTPEEPR